MSVMVLQVFVSLMLVAGSVALFVFTVRARTLEHADRLSLSPLDDDERTQPVAPSVEPQPLRGQNKS
jgi:nitrogen fixation-related uncharacterized protein